MKMKRFLAAFLMLAILLTGLTVTASAETGWVKKDGLWYYYKADGTLLKNDWVQSSGKWYYLGSEGVMVTDDVLEINDKYYAFDKNGVMAANSWYEKIYNEDASNWFYSGADGALVKGWKQIKGKWYYFHGGQTKDKDSYPVMVTRIPRTWNSETGAYESLFDNGKFYAFKPTGEMIVGWGAPYADGTWFLTDNYWVYANADGSLVTKSWKKIGGKWYYFGSDGQMYWDGPHTTGDPNDKNVYLFNASGALVENGWFQPFWKNEDGTVEYYDWYYGGKDGVVQKGWIQDKGKWYYLDAEDGSMWTGWAPMDDGKIYYLDETSGAMVTGWKQIDNIWYFFNDSGARVENDWVKTGGKWYYLKEGGKMAVSQTLEIKGKKYTFDANGAWVE